MAGKAGFRGGAREATGPVTMEIKGKFSVYTAAPQSAGLGSGTTKLVAAMAGEGSAGVPGPDEAGVAAAAGSGVDVGGTAADDSPVVVGAGGAAGAAAVADGVVGISRASAVD